ncbi:GNAT family N-acetyltransferase [Desulfocurvibacter africanus]|uniref:GNAT family N-acetyltransferase n=1 Tax=Desulfocurvibacter africanus TaxID=873 RepID=UPI000401B23E|nr:N-acetyltransferase [Desulfocurvibacter africanus]
MVIRRETEAEFPQIYDLVKVAFQTAKVSNGKEQDFVNQLRSGGNYIPELALVAEENGQLVGHIMLTKAHVVDGETKFETLLLAPISVALEYRNRGIGSALIKESFRLAKARGYTSVLLVGDPAYYHRYGFRTAAGFGIKPTHPIPDENVMACELAPNALRGVSGTTDCF